MKAKPKKKTSTRRVIKSKRAISLGRSPVTGFHVLMPAGKGASITLDDVRRVVRELEPLVFD